MDKLIKDVSIIDIEHVFNTGALTNSSKTCEEITVALNRLDKVITLLASQTQINSLQIKHLKRVLENLNQLNGYYQERLKEVELLESAETKFIATILISKLNRLNTKLGLSDWNILFTGSKADQSDSLVKLHSEYELNESMSQQKRQPSYGSSQQRAKLRVKSIFLEDAGSALALNEDYLCSAYQFESNEFLVTEFKNNQTLMLNHRQPRSKSHAKQPHLMSKRSSSADLNSLKNRRSNRDSRDKLIAQDTPAGSTPDPTLLNNPTRLNEKCLAFTSFKFKSSKHLNQHIDIQPACKYMIILIYKLVKPLSDQTDQFKLPIKYIQLNEHHLKNHSAPMLQNYKLPLSPVIENLLATNTGQKTTQQNIHLLEDLGAVSNSSVFRRMFKRSKSINRNRLNNMSIGKEETDAQTVSIKPPVRNLIDIDLTFEQSDLIGKDFNVETFKTWQKIWRPQLDARTRMCKEFSPATKHFELLTIYLKDLSALNESDNPSDLYFIEIHMSDSETKEKLSSYFQSNLFRLGDKINDLYQVPLSFEQRASLRFYLFRLREDNNQKPIQLALSSQIEMSRRNLLVSELSLIPHESPSNSDGSTSDHIAYNFYTLKLQCSFQSELYPTASRISIELFNYKLVNKLDKEKELLHMVDVFAKAGNFDEPVLVRKFLEFFAILSSNAPTDEHAAKNKSDRRIIRVLLLSKIYEVFIKVIESCFYSADCKQSKIQSRADIGTILKDFKYNPKQAIHFLLNFLKNQLDTLIEAGTVTAVDSQPDLLVMTFKTFDKLIEIIHLLSSGNNQSKLELKYEINDLIVKLFGSKSSVNSNQQRKELHLSNLRLTFIDTICLLFSGSELASLVNTNFLVPASDCSPQLLQQLSEQILHLDTFNTNNQFRDCLTTYLLKSNNLTSTNTSTKNLLACEQLHLVESLLSLRAKLSKQNTDQLATTVTPNLIHSLINQVRLTNGLKTNTDSCESMMKHLLCLIDLLDIILQDPRTSKALIESTDKTELNSLIEIVLFYFKCDKLFKLFSSRRPRLWHRTNLVVLKFAKHAQKYLQRCLITTEEIHDLTSQRQAPLTNDVSNTSSDQLVRNYIDMVFAFVDTPTNSYSLTMEMKLEMLQTLQLFWKCLNISLKRSTSLNELIAKRLCHSILSNFYFKLHEPELDSKPTVYLNPTPNTKTLTFYENIFQFLSDLLAINSTPSFQGFSDFLLVSLMNSIFKREKLNRKHKMQACYQKSCASLILDRLEMTASVAKLFQSENQRKQVFELVRTCSDFNVLKEDKMSNQRVSIIEQYLVTYELIKQIDRVSSHSDSKRKIKMYLLDDLYSLHKLEKNHLYMSYVRKEQADLLEWSYNRKSSNESELKEILYLKSLKRFAMQSASSTQSTQSESAGTSSSLSSSLSSCKASSRSSYMSSQSSIDSDSSTTTSPTSSPSSSSSSPISTPSSLSLSASLKLDQTGIRIQSEICKQLSAYYEKLDDPSFTHGIQNAESKFLQLAAASRSDPRPTTADNKPVHLETEANKSNQHGHLYFRVGIFGSALALTSISNKYFLYRHHTCEMLSNIQSLIMNKISKSFDWHQDQTLSLASESNDESECGSSIHKVSLLHHNQMPDVSLKQNTDTSCLQICAVNRLAAHRLLDLVDEMIESKECDEIKLRLSRADRNALFYYFDRPFYMSTSRANEAESVENLWIERSLLVIDENAARFESLSQYEEIKATFKVLLNPVRNAINDINDKTKELKSFIVQFSTNSGGQVCQMNVMHNLQPLTMRLLGCLDARVNGGLIKYVKELFCQSLASSKQFRKKGFLMQQLYLSIKDQLNVLESGLSIHNRILKSVTQMSESVGKQDGDSEANVENLKHMNQLNEHLIECLAVIEQELSERWSKFSSLNNTSSSNSSNQCFKEKDCKKLNLV